MGLLAPWFLGGLLALGVPVFVHLLRRHVAVPRPVSSLMFFERGTQSSRRHRRIRHRLLFALRAMMLLLIVLAFSGLFVRRQANDPKATLLMVVLDNSFSMRSGTRFADAKRDALALLAAKPAGQRAQILALGSGAGNGVEVLTQPDEDAAPLRNALESIQQSDGQGSFGELGRVVRALHEGTPGAADLHLFSDVQRTAAPADFADMVLPQETRLTIHAVEGAHTLPNWTVASVDAPADLADPRDAGRSRVQAVIAGWNTPAATKAVSLMVNGNVVATKNVAVPPNGCAVVEFSPLPITFGFNRCEVRMNANDALPQDDAARFVVRRSDPARVLFVHGAGDTRSPLYFGSALQAASHGAFTLQSIVAAETETIDPTHFAFAVLSDVGSLPAAFERSVREYVRRGGNVLLAVGTAADMHRTIPLWDAPVREARQYSRSGAAAAVGTVDFSYPAFADAQPGRDNGGWAGTSILVAAAVDPADARVAARLSDGTPLLLDRSVGEGHLLLFTTGFDNVTNDLPLHPVFVAFVDRLSRYLSGMDNAGSSRRVGTYLQLRAANAGATAASAVQATGPDGKRLLTLAESHAAQGVRLTRTGFYQVRFANGRDAVISVNADPRESDLAPMSAEMQELWTGRNTAAAADPAMSRNAAAPATQTRRVGLWWGLTLLALLVAAAQAVLASGYTRTQREEA